MNTHNQNGYKMMFAPTYLHSQRAYLVKRVQILLLLLYSINFSDNFVFAGMHM